MNRFLSRAISLILLVLITINIVDSLLFLPDFPFSFFWNDELKLEVFESDNEDLEDGDIIVAVDDTKVQYNNRIFNRKFQSDYRITFIRENLVSIAEVPRLGYVPEIHISNFIVYLVVLLTWSVGFYLTELDETQLKNAGIILQIFSLIGSSIYLVVAGFEVGFFSGNILINLFPPLLITLVTYSKSEKSAYFEKFTSLVFWAISLILSLVALYLGYFSETLWSSSINLFDVSYGTALLSCIAIISSGIILILQIKRASNEQEKTNSKILFFGCLIAMTCFVGFISYSIIFGRSIPTEFIFGIWLLIPTSFLLIALRIGHPYRDFKIVIVFEYIILILSGLFITYGMIEFISNQDFNQAYQNLILGCAIIVFIIAATTKDRWLNIAVKELLFKKIDEKSLNEIADLIYKSPSKHSIQKVLETVSSLLGMSKLLIVQKNNLQTENTFYHGLSSSDLGDTLTLLENDGIPAWSTSSLKINQGAVSLGTLYYKVGERNLNGYELAFLKKVVQYLGIGLHILKLNFEANLLSERILFIGEEERNRISTELHNNPLQDIAIIHQKLQTALSQTDADKIAQDLENVSIKIREIIAGIQPKIINENPYWIVKAKASEFEENNPHIQMKTVCDNNLIDSKTSKHVRSAIYYILTEALNNILKHANATTISIEIKSLNSSYALLSVEDNGVGFAKSSPELLLQDNHFGIASIHKWAKIAKGHFSIDTSMGEGVALTFEFPLN